MAEFSEEGLDELWRDAERSRAEHVADFRHYREWANVCASIELRLGRGEFRAMMGKATIQTVARGIVTISLPTRMHRDWCESRYGTMILADWKAQNRAVRHVDFICPPASIEAVRRPPLPVRPPVKRRRLAR